MALKKSNRVTWAPGPKLCQVKHFSEEDCPSKVGMGSQHPLQLKQTRPSIIKSSSEGRHCLKESKERLSNLPLAKWKCPPKFNLNEKWRVVAGEESKEAEDQEHREKRVLEAVYPSQSKRVPEAVYPSRSAIPPNPSTSSDLDQYYDDNQTPVVPIIPIEEAADIALSLLLTQFQNISSKSPDTYLPNSPSSSVSIVTSEKLLTNEISVPQSLSTFPYPRKPQSNSPPSVRWPSDVQSACPYYSRCQNLKGSEQTHVSPKAPVSYNSVPQQYQLICKNLSTPDQTEFSPDLPANQNHAPKYQTICENQNISQLKSQVSGMPPANRYPFTQFPSTCEIPDIPQHQIEVLPKSLTNHYPATQCHSTYENLTAAQCSNQNSQIPANDICMLQYQSNGQNLGIPKHKTQVCSYPPANEKSILEMPHGFEGDLTAAVAAFAQSQEQGSLIDTNLLVELLQNPDQLRKLMNEHGMATSPTTGAASGSKPILLSSTTPRSTADSLDKQIAGNENHKCVADSTVFSRSLEVRNTYERRGTAAMSRPVDLLVPSPRTKPDQVINKPINEYQAPRAGSGPKTIAKSVPLAITKPETSMKSNLANEQGPPPHVGTADVIRSKTLAHPTSNLNLEKIKKLINKYGAPDNVGAKPLVNSELIPSSFSKCDVVLSGADLPTTLQPQLQIMTGSPNAGNTPPFSSMTSPAPVHKDINYYKSLIKHHGENCESAADELLPNASPRDGKTRGPGLLKNLKPNQRSLNSRKRCSFFNTPRGCRNGSSCPFLHDMSGQTRSGGMSNDQGSKRMKVSGKLTSRA